ncbi:MAG: UPF0164 family protein [Sediminispirochaetaceae bacterium]
MKPTVCLVILLLFLSLHPQSGYTEDLSDFYFDYSSFADSPLFRDPNTGRTIFPTLLVPMGGKYEGMGTAYTAVADDSGYIEANPAGSSLLAKTELSLHHNNWIADSSLESAVYTVRDNNLGLGFAGKFLYLPFTAFNEWGDRDSRGYISESVLTANISYNFLSSYNFHGISLGSSVKLGYRNIPSAVYPDQSIFTAMTDIGALTRFNFLKAYPSRDKNFSLGIAAKNLGLPSDGEPLPSLASAGLSYSPLRPLTLALDINYPFAFSLPSEEWEKAYFAGGMDVRFTDFLSIHSGFTHRGGNPRFSLGSGLELEKMKINLNYTLDMTTQLHSADRFSIEANMDLGDRGRGAAQERLEEYYTAGLDSYTEGDYERAIKFWEAALDIDPTFQPASENIQIAQRSLSLQRTMRELEKVE